MLITVMRHGINVEVVCVGAPVLQRNSTHDGFPACCDVTNHSRNGKTFFFFFPAITQGFLKWIFVGDGEDADVDSSPWSPSG